MTWPGFIVNVKGCFVKEDIVIVTLLGILKISPKDHKRRQLIATWPQPEDQPEPLATDNKQQNSLIIGTLDQDDGTKPPPPKLRAQSL